jgi:hypothetical protein
LEVHLLVLDHLKALEQGKQYSASKSATVCILHESDFHLEVLRFFQALASKRLKDDSFGDKPRNLQLEPPKSFSQL